MNGKKRKGPVSRLEGIKKHHSGVASELDLPVAALTRPPPSLVADQAGSRSGRLASIPRLSYPVTIGQLSRTSWRDGVSGSQTSHYPGQTSAEGGGEGARINNNRRNLYGGGG
ncbi:hypothetical protein RRG08_065250 [Elysia crispata]|uniref:Uncharacterized protein n=1 Tax=Elysia crispata TaxID=231223 RepID=A0AAE1CYT9_9GAST|nr:hypothetical protein RRG08_065250 [Elysia crispata]